MALNQICFALIVMYAITSYVQEVDGLRPDYDTNQVEKLRKERSVDNAALALASKSIYDTSALQLLGRSLAEDGGLNFLRIIREVVPVPKMCCVICLPPPTCQCCCNGDPTMTC